MPAWKHRLRLLIDTETTGVDDVAKIVELGAVTMDGGRVLARRGMLINPGIPIPAEATSIHGIADTDVARSPSIEEIAERFLSVVADAQVIAGYNLCFDARVLARELGPAWGRAIAGKLLVDPLVVVRMDHVGRYWKNGPDKGRHKLGNVAARFGIEVARGHRATDDCITAGRVLEHLLCHLPDDSGECAALLACEAEKQERSFQEWLSRQPPLEKAS